MNSMRIQEYIDQKKELYDLLFQFIDNSDESDDDFLFLINFIEINQYHQKKKEMEQFLRLLLQISNNHHRFPGFLTKIEKIIIHFKDQIKQAFSKLEIFQIFENNKSIVLFLIQKGILEIDEIIYKLIFSKIEINGLRYCHFFIPELKAFNNDFECEDETNILDDYEQKRQKGENDSYVCSLIRNDSVEEFIRYINQNNWSLNRTVQPSIFETNSFLIDKIPTLIEYAAFFGSIQIFQFLRLNNIELPQSLWLYTIHSNHPELIHLLEENNVIPINNSYHSCFLEAIKCHHNDIAHYIQDNFLVQVEDENMKESFFECICQNYNYSFFPNNNLFIYNYHFYYLSSYNHSTIVNLFLRMKSVEIEAKLILKSIFFIIMEFYIF